MSSAISMSSAHSPTFPSLHLRHSSFSTLPPLYLRHSSISNSSVALPMSQLILQPSRCFTYATAHSPTLLSLLLRHNIFTYVTWRAAHALEFFRYIRRQAILHVVDTLILQAFRRFTYDIAHSPTLPSLYLRHSSFSNPPVASPTPQLIPQPFFRFSYVTGFSLMLPGEPPMRRGELWF